MYRTMICSSVLTPSTWREPPERGVASHPPAADKAKGSTLAVQRRTPSVLVEKVNNKIIGRDDPPVRLKTFHRVVSTKVDRFLNSSNFGHR
jgi:hypothetical protein